MKCCENIFPQGRKGEKTEGSEKKKHMRFGKGSSRMWNTGGFVYLFISKVGNIVCVHSHPVEAQISCVMHDKTLHRV